MLTIDLAGERVSLWADRALSWERRRALFVADLHLGKPATFRSAGVPAPEATTGADLARLDRLLEASRSEQLFILGDLLHARAGRAEETMRAVSAWTTGLHQRGIGVTLVRGNHDRSAGDPPLEWRLNIVDAPLIEGPFALVHEPPDSAPEHYTLAGHLHPAVMLDCPTGAAMRAPCFWFGARVGVLPAFGSFTGARAVRPARSDRVFVVGEGQIVEVSSSAASPTA